MSKIANLKEIENSKRYTRPCDTARKRNRTSLNFPPSNAQLHGRSRMIFSPKCLSPKQQRGRRAPVYFDWTLFHNHPASLKLTSQAMLSRAATVLQKRNAIISYELIIIIVTSSTSGNTGRAVPRARRSAISRRREKNGTITLDKTLRGHYLLLLSFIFHLQRMHTSMKDGSARVPAYLRGQLPDPWSCISFPTRD